MNLLKKTILILDRINELFFKLSAYLCLILVLLTAEQVVARYFFNASSIGLQELQWHLFGFIFLLSTAHAFKEDAHVRVDVFYQKFPDRIKRIVNSLGIILFIIPTCLIIIYFGYEYVVSSLSYDNSKGIDYFSAALISKESLLYSIISPIEKVLRLTILKGEISPNPGGLEARWIIKSVIPLGFTLLLLQSISELLKNLFIKENNGH